MSNETSVVLDLTTLGVKVIKAKVKVPKLGQNFIQVEIGSQVWTTRLTTGNRPIWNSFHVFSNCETEKAYFTLFEKHDKTLTEIANTNVYLKDVYGKKTAWRPLVSGVDYKGKILVEFTWNKDPEGVKKKPKQEACQMVKAKTFFTQPKLRSPKSLMATWRDEKAKGNLRSFNKSWNHDSFPPTTPFKSQKSIKTPTSQAATQFYNSKRMDKETCSGDFCKYILAGIANHEEVDFDDLVRQARAIHTGQSVKEATNFRLNMALEYLKSEKDKARSSKVRNFVPYKYIFRGRQIMVRGNLSSNPQNDMELDIPRLMKSIKNPEQEARDKAEMDLKAKQCPYYLYEQAQVCDRCYAVYSQIRSYVQSLKPNSRKHKKQLSKLEDSPTLESPLAAIVSEKKNLWKGLLTPSLAKSQVRDRYFTSPLGKIDKFNLDDLLIDIEHEKNPEATDYFRTMTQESKNNRLSLQKSQESISYAPTVVQEDIARSSQQFFVLDTLNPIRLKDPKEEGRKIWMKYRRHLNLNVPPVG